MHNFISKLPVEKPLIRYNWTVLPTRELHLSRWVSYGSGPAWCTCMYSWAASLHPCRA